MRVGAGEPLGCVRCSPRGSTTYYPLTDILARVAEIAESWQQAPGPNVMLGGPDPFGHPELPAIVAGCVKHGAERICIETDGGALSVQGNAEGALASGVRHLHVRVLAAAEPVSDDLSGRLGLVRDAKAGVRAFLTAAEGQGTAVAVTAIMPVCSHSLGALPPSVGAVAAWPVHAVRLVAAGPLPDSAAGVVAAACDTGMVNRLWVETDGTLPLPNSHRLHAVAGDSCDG